MTISRIPSVEGGIQPTLLTAKGDLISATAASTVARLAVGSDSQILVADSSTATGLKWAAPSGGGKVLQVVEGSTTTPVTNTSSTYADTGVTATITPTSASSKILVFFTSNGNYRTGDTSGNEMRMKLFRGATELSFQTHGWTGTALNLLFGSISQSYLDSPATTSATTYKTQFMNPANASLVKVQNDNSRSSIILMEIGA
jgi:hypothetical protein